ncbi:cold-inducible protein YdjO-related protein [Bacillus sp. N9]
MIWKCTNSECTCWMRDAFSTEEKPYAQFVNQKWKKEQKFYQLLVNR